MKRKLLQALKIALEFASMGLAVTGVWWWWCIGLIAFAIEVLQMVVLAED